MKPRFWNGKTVHVTQTDPLHDRREVDVALTRETAGQLANLLRKANSGLGTVFDPLPAGLNELMNALDYVLVGDPASVKAHHRMEAGKGMTPDGGHKAPDARVTGVVLPNGEEESFPIRRAFPGPS